MTLQDFQRIALYLFLKPAPAPARWNVVPAGAGWYRYNVTLGHYQRLVPTADFQPGDRWLGDAALARLTGEPEAVK